MSIRDILTTKIVYRCGAASEPDMGFEFMRDVEHLVDTSDAIPTVTVTTVRNGARISWVKLERRVSRHVGSVETGVIVQAMIEECRVRLLVLDVVESHPAHNPEEAVAMAIGFLNGSQDMSLLKVHALHGKPPKVHELKCAPDPYRELDRGRKLFEYRKNDRNFQVGDVLDLREFARKDIVDTPEGALYTGARTRRLVTYILRGPAFGVPEGYAVLSLGAMP